jgi:hypothetical protein
MTGADYANLVAGYLARRFAPRALQVYREIRVGKTIIGKNRCIDIFCIAPAQGDTASKDTPAQRAFAIECKFQDSQGTVDEKIPYALCRWPVALPMQGRDSRRVCCTCSPRQGTPRSACRSRDRLTAPPRRVSSITCSPSTSAGGTC